MIGRTLKGFRRLLRDPVGVENAVLGTVTQGMLRGCAASRTLGYDM